MPYSLMLQRVVSRRTNDQKIAAQCEYILKRGMGGGRGKTWEASYHPLPAIQRDDGNWLFKCRFNFEKKRGDRGGDAEYKQWEEIKAMITQTGQVQHFMPFPWTVDTTARPTADLPVQRPVTQQAVATQPAAPVLDPDALATTPLPQPAGFEGLMSDVMTAILGGVRTIQPFGPAKKWDQLVVPDDLLGPNSDAALAQHSAWKNLYGVNPQIRLILSNIKRAHETNGESRNHGVLFGHAGCGKTTAMFALESMFGSDAVLKLDGPCSSASTSLTPMAGVGPTSSCPATWKSSSNGSHNAPSPRSMLTPTPILSSIGTCRPCRSPVAGTKPGLPRTISGQFKRFKAASSLIVP